MFNGNRTSMAIEEEIRAMEEKIRQYKAELENVREQEYKEALQHFIDRFDLKTVEAVDLASRRLASFEGKEAPEAQVKKHAPVEAEPVHAAEPLRQQRKEAAAVERPHETAEDEVKAAPKNEPATPEKKEPVKPEEDLIWDDFNENFDLDEALEKEPATAEEPAEEEPAADPMDDDMWDIFGTEEPVEEKTDEAAKAPAEEPAEDDFDSMFDDLVSEAPVANKFDVDAVMLVEEEDTALASFKKKNTIAKAEMSLVKSIDAAYQEGWIDDASVMDTLFTAENLQDGLDQYKEAGILLEHMDDVFGEKAGDASAAQFEDFSKFPYQIRCRALLLAKNDIAAVIA